MSTVSYKCPKCAAPLSFDIDSQDWRCQFCLSQFSKEELEAVEVQSDSDTFQLDEHPESFGGGAVAYTCPSCGGSIVTDEQTVATFCVFCHSPTIIASRLEDSPRPEKVIPFKLKKEEAVSALQKLCRKKPFLPRDFHSYGMKGEVSGLYVPFWLFDSEFRASMSGSGTKVTTWKDRDYRYTKTDTFRIARSGRVSFLKIPADGSSKMDDDLMDALEPFDYKQMDSFRMEYLSGHFAESYDVGANEALQRIKDRTLKDVSALLQQTIRGYAAVHTSQANVQTVKADYTYVMFPVWTLMVPYDGKTYTFAMNGQTGKMAGKLPFSYSRFIAFFAGFGAALSVIIMLLGGIL